MAGVPIETPASLAEITQWGVIPVVVLDEAVHAETLGEALIAGGLPVAEVTFRTSAAAEAIRRLVARGDILVGAGTVLTVDQLEEAVAAGARFVVSPGLSAEVVRRAQEIGIPILPGIGTATELMAAKALGLTTVKFFPAAILGGAPAIKALAGAFPGMHFVPTGGVNPGNLSDYLGLEVVPAVGGSWMVPSKLVASGDVDALTQLVRDAVAAAAAIR